MARHQQQVVYNSFDPFFKYLKELERVSVREYSQYGERKDDWGIALLEKSIPKKKSDIEKLFSIELDKLPDGKILIKRGSLRKVTHLSTGSLARTLWCYFVDTSDYLPLFVLDTEKDGSTKSEAVQLLRDYSKKTKARQR